MNEATQNRTKHREEIVVYGWAAKLQITKPGYKDRPVDSSGHGNQINWTICTNTSESFFGMDNINFCQSYFVWKQLMSSVVILGVKPYIYCRIAMTVFGKKGFFNGLFWLFFRAVMIFWWTLISYLLPRAIKALSPDYTRNPEGILVHYNATINHRLGSLVEW